MTQLDADRVRLELDVERVMDAFGLRGPLRNGWYRLAGCPRCGEKSNRGAIAIEASTGRWLHHGRERGAGGECSGDIFDLVAACEGVDARRDFGRVLARAAEIAGITSGARDPELDARIAQRLRDVAAADLEDRARRQAAARDAATYWDALAAHSADGENYLQGRGLNPYPLIAADAVRFATSGDPCVAIRGVSGRVVTVATRHREPGDRPKVVVRRGTSTAGTMVDAIERIEHGRDVVLCEGVMDALTARIAWPGAVVLGANGAGNVAKIAKAAIGRVRLARARLLLVPHADEPGIRAMTAAGQIALGAGLSLEQDLLAVALPAPDLNAAWTGGWRPEGWIA